MKKIFISSILIVLFSISLSAKEYYVKVMSISDSTYLNGVKKDIGKLGYKTYISKQGKWHMVYAGPFENSQKATKALSIVRKNISKDAFLTKITAKTPKKSIKKQTVPAQKKIVAVPIQRKKEKKVLEKVLLEDIIPVQEKSVVPQKKEKKKAVGKVLIEDIIPVQEKTVAPKEQEKKKSSVSSVQIEEKEETLKEVLPEDTISTQSKKDKGFYIALAAGLSTVDIQQSGSMPFVFKLEDSGLNYNAEIGYYFNDNIFISINYQTTDLENVTLDSAFTTLNYQLDEIYSISPYIGVIAGYSTRTEGTITTEIETVKINAVSSFMGGLQVGSDISLYNGLSLYLYYRYLIMDTTTNIENTDSGESKAIQYGNEQNLNMGIKYHF